MGIILGDLVTETLNIVGRTLFDGKTLGMDRKIGLPVRFCKDGFVDIIGEGDQVNENPELDKVGCGEEILVGPEISDVFVTFVEGIEGILDTERVGELLTPEGIVESSGGNERKVGRKEGEGNCGARTLGREEGNPYGRFCGRFENGGDGTADGCEDGKSDGSLTE